MKHQRKKDELETLIETKQKLERIEKVKKWKEFEALPDYQKFAHRKAWDEYYIQVRATVAYQIFQEQRTSLAIMREHPKTPLAEERRQRVKDLAEDARRMQAESNLELLEPSFSDPWELDYSGEVRLYKNATRRIQELTEEDFRSP